MTHASLFSGIGGFDLASQWMGWENIFHCENNEFCQKILKHHFPNSISYGDITKTDFIIHRGTIDILTGGFPCQPFSVAGKRKGTEDDRHLWPEMLRAIREIQPSWIVGENVPGIINWSKELVFKQVQIDLENEGYEVWSVILPACSVNAPHRRDRIWFIATNNDGKRFEWNKELTKGFEYNGRREAFGEFDTYVSFRNVTDANSQGLQKRISTGFESIQSKAKTFEGSEFTRNNTEDNWRKFPTQSPIYRRNDGVFYRMDRLKALGNAIVPQVVYEIFKVIEIINNNYLHM